MRRTGHALIFVVLTVVTQVGGLVWLASRLFRWPLVAFAVIYTGVWAGVQVTAPLLGRVPVPCRGEVLREQSVLYCALMRNFVVPELKAVAEGAAARVAAEHPGTVTLALDGGFPFAGFPLLPHLSHDDGEKLDLAFSYAGPEGEYVPGLTRSPIGYFAFEALEARDPCPPVWLTLRWSWQVPLRDAHLDPARTSALVRAVLADARVGKVFLEPALAERLGLADPGLRFQGCRAARHDDHVHVQLSGPSDG